MGLPQGNLLALQKSFQSTELRAQILDEFCQVCGYNPQIRYPAPVRSSATKIEGGNPKGRRPTYGAKVIMSLTAIWEAAGYPCSARLKALLPLWRPWAIKRLGISAEVQKQLLSISPLPWTDDSRPKSAN